MRMHGVLVAFILAAGLGLANAQAPSGQNPSTPPVTPAPAQKPVAELPPPTPSPLTKPPSAIDPLIPIAPVVKSDADKLRDSVQGVWTAVYTDNDAFKNSRMSFGPRKVSIQQGESTIEVPFTVQLDREHKRIAIRVLNQELTGSFTLLDEQVLTIRFNPMSASGVSSLVVLTKVAQTALTTK